ncbi:phosphatase PAP2 family protein [Aquimarina spongiae]|uniref:PAP2 superfamily protein n=1 Tax=Aquimarina spongiae TaxID=570521 RepID=A0A1M6D3Q7_9FLAO|nr:phosphatase PAP2 family protein [Aquimarina spongiae]SHI67713.1 PAP2 superfamily protein [Aquimarina spongiae]
MKKIISLWLVCLCCHTSIAQLTPKSEQKNDFTKYYQTEQSVKKRKLTGRLVPIALITTGVLLSTNDFEQSLQKDLRSSIGNDFNTKIDDYTRYIPVLQMYTADILGVKAQNHWFDQTKILILSSLLSNGTSTLLKKEIYKKRPGDYAENSTHANSFPSGHTTTAFTTASVLYEEFKDTSPALAYSGYAFAVMTGALRMMNNAHYLSDVLVGAGIGILATKVVYHFEYLFDWNPFKNLKGVAFAPQYNDSYGLGFYFTKVF